MKLIFLDDTKHQADAIGIGNLHGFGGIIIDAEKVKNVEKQISFILEKYGIHKNCEIKWSLPRNSPLRNLTGKVREDFYIEVLSLLSSYEASVVVVLWADGYTYIGEDRIIDNLIEFTFERFSGYLRTNHEKAIVIADRPSGGQKEIDKFISKFEKQYLEGTKYVSSEDICHNILTTPSKLCRGLQLADLVVSITASMVAGKQRFAKPLFLCIRKAFIKNNYGGTAGTGLKIFPDDLINLYHWVLDETHYIKVGMNLGFPFPFKNRNFTKNPYLE